jgi:CHAD domain-containing protein
MRGDAWPRHCRAALVAAVATAARQFPRPGEETAERVHDVRKTLKEARALARLFLRCVGEPARVTMAALAVARRRVGRARDLDVIALRLHRLAPPSEIAEPLAAAIAREREAARRAQGGLAARATHATLNAIVKRLEAWDLSAVGPEELVAAVTRTYRQARRRGRLAFDSREPAALHALRARVVDLRYQLSALAPAWPAALNAQAEELNALRDTLGAFNDLEMLAKFVAERGGLSPEAHADLTARIEARQKKLRRRAKTEFDRLFVETPRAFGDRLTAYLERPMETPAEGAKVRSTA